jgi:hypothetical protein
MIIAPLVSLASDFIDSLLPANAPAKAPAPATAKETASSSPFAQLLSTLEQLDQSSLSSYRQNAPLTQL